MHDWLMGAVGGTPHPTSGFICQDVTPTASPVTRRRSWRRSTKMAQWRQPSPCIQTSCCTSLVCIDPWWYRGRGACTGCLGSGGPTGLEQRRKAGCAGEGQHWASPRPALQSPLQLALPCSLAPVCLVCVCYSDPLSKVFLLIHGQSPLVALIPSQPAQVSSPGSVSSPPYSPGPHLRSPPLLYQLIHDSVTVGFGCLDGAALFTHLCLGKALASC